MIFRPVEAAARSPSENTSSQIGVTIATSIWLAFGGKNRQASLVQTPVGPSLQIVLLVADAFAEVSAAALREVWERWIGPQRFHRKLAQFAEQGWVQAPADSESVSRVVRLTEAGRLAAIGGRDPEARWKRAWDGRWRLVLFDIPEERLALRAKLRRKLCELGFGYLQNSVWISPDSTESLAAIMQGTAVDVESFSLMEARPCGGESDADIANGAWDFARINRNYAAYLDILKSAPVSRGGARARMNWFDVEWRAWCRAVRSDPLLPAALLPTSYRGRDAWQQRCDTLRRIVKRA